MKRVLILDDEDMVRKTLKNKFPPDEYEVIEAKSVDEVFGVLNSVPAIDVAIVDLRLEPGEEEGEETGLNVISPSIIRIFREHRRELAPPPVVIVLTAYPSILSCKKAMKEGAYDYLDKNEPDAYDKLINSIEQGLKERSAPEEYGERRWLEEHYDEEIGKYRGKRIAIHNEEVIASVDTIEELDTILMEYFPRIKPFIVYIPEVSIDPFGDPVFVEVTDPFSVLPSNSRGIFSVPFYLQRALR